MLSNYMVLFSLISLFVCLFVFVFVFKNKNVILSFFPSSLMTRHSTAMSPASFSFIQFNLTQQSFLILFIQLPLVTDNFLQPRCKPFLIQFLILSNNFMVLLFILLLLMLRMFAVY